MKRLCWILICLMVSFIALAANANQVSKHVEASMVVTGWIEIALDGDVQGYTLDQSDKLPQPVVDIVNKTVAKWKFKPVLIEGKPVLAKAKMNLRVVASPRGSDQYSLRVRGATFGDGDKDASPGYKSTRLPDYPTLALRESVGGTVYVALQIGRDGRVEQAVARQVDLRATGTEREMESARKAFADASLDAVKRWTFNVPSTGSVGDADHWTVTVPINFNIWGTRQPGYGQWDAYVPGPVQQIPWEESQVTTDSNVDAVPDGLALLQDAHFVLLTPLGS